MKKPALDELKERFLSQYPDGFRDQAYLADERNYKWQAHEHFSEFLNSGAARELLQSTDLQGVRDGLARAANKARPFLSRFESMAFNDALALDEPRHLRRFIEALFGFIARPSRDTFQEYATALGQLHQKKSRVDTWPVATLLPFIARPLDHMFIKPEVTRSAQNWLGVELCLDSDLDWLTYERTLNLASSLRGELSPLGAQDNIDIQGFLFCVFGASKR